MKKIVFVAHEFGNFNGHGGIAEYLNILVSQILKRHSEYEVYVITIEYDKKSDLLGNSRLTVYSLKPQSTHEMGKKVLKYLKEIKPDIVECTDYMALCLEALCYRNKTEKNELSRTKFVTVHHTASRECYEWNDKVPVKFAPEFVRECFLREKTQMKLSDINVAPSNFMRNYVMQNYNLKNVEVILHPFVFDDSQCETLLEDVKNNYELQKNKNTFIISCISRIEGRKNQAALVQQFIRFLKITSKDVILILAGNSSINSVTGQYFRDEIYELIPDEYKLNIHFYDFMSGEDKQKIYAISDLAILASPYECLSLALVEAVSYNIPVIASKYCGFIDYMGTASEKMTFNPFEENSLLDRIIAFSKMSLEQRRSFIIKADYTKTVDSRMALYEQKNVMREKHSHNTLIVGTNNYCDVIDAYILNYKYDGILVSFYYNPACTNELKEIFENISDFFDSGDIICYSSLNVISDFSDILNFHIPFYVKGIDWNAMIGKKIIEVVSSYGAAGNVYNLLDNHDGLKDMVNWEIPDKVNIQRNRLWKKLLSDNFYSKYALNLEAKYVE